MAPDTEQDWIDVGLDGDDLIRHCTCTGWALQDVLDVLSTDGASANPLDWCYTGLDPLEVRAAIRGGVRVEPSLHPSAPNGEMTTRSRQHQRTGGAREPVRHD